MPKLVYKKIPPPQSNRPCSLDQVHPEEPSPSGVKSTWVTIKRSFRAIVTVQYSWRGCTCLSPFKIENSTAEFNKMNRREGRMAAGIEGDRCFCIFPSLSKLGLGKNSFDICSNAGHRSDLWKLISWKPLAWSLSLSLFLKKIHCIHDAWK